MDIALLRRESGLFDFAIIAPDLQRGFDLETAINISLFTNRRANDDDEPDLFDRQGWWGDNYLPNAGDRIGSRLWLLTRRKQTQETLNDALEYVQECLQWLIDDGVAETIDVDNEWIRRGVMGISISIKKPEGVIIEFDYEYVWDEIENAF